MGLFCVFCLQENQFFILVFWFVWEVQTSIVSWEIQQRISQDCTEYHFKCKPRLRFLGQFFSISFRFYVWQHRLHYVSHRCDLIAALTTKAFHLRPFIRFIIIMTMFRARWLVCKQNTRPRSNWPAANQNETEKSALVIKSTAVYPPDTPCILVCG